MTTTLTTKRRQMVVMPSGKIRRFKAKSAVSSWHKVARELLLKKHGNACHWCGVEMRLSGDPDDPMSATIEHLVRRADGGGENIENLKLAHKHCNNTRHHQH